MDKLKTGMLVMLVGIAIIGSIMSVSASPYADCAITDGQNWDTDHKEGIENTASCCLSTVCGQYDGYPSGEVGEGWHYSDHLKCTGDVATLDVTSYYDHGTAEFICWIC